MSEEAMPRVSLDELREMLRPVIQKNEQFAGLIDRCDVFTALYGIGGDAYRRRCESGYYDRLCRHCHRDFGVHTFELAACPYPHTTLFSALTCQAAVAGAGNEAHQCGATCLPGSEHCPKHL
jgi:hypothetical protein